MNVIRNPLIERHHAVSLYATRYSCTLCRSVGKFNYYGFSYSLHITIVVCLHSLHSSGISCALYYFFAISSRCIPNLGDLQHIKAALSPTQVQVLSVGPIGLRTMFLMLPLIQNVQYVIEFDQACRCCSRFSSPSLYELLLDHASETERILSNSLS